MNTRHRRRSGKSHRWLLFFAVLVIGGIVTALVMPMLVMNWVKGYLQKETFRNKMEQLFGTQIQGEVDLSPLRWTGDEVTASEASMATVTGWEARLDGLRLAIDWNAFRQGKWRVTGASVDSLVLDKKAATAAQISSVDVPTKPEPMSEDDSLPAWLRRYLPTETEVDGLHVSRLNILHPGPWSLQDAKVNVSTWKKGETSVQAVVEGGILETPVVLPAQTVPVKLNLTRASARLSPEDLHLKEAHLKWLNTGEITARGHLRPQEGTWDAALHVEGIPLSECLTEDWKLRLSGVFNADLDAQGRLNASPTITGKAQLTEGVLTALPILDRLASYTGVERFKRLVLDVVSSQVHITEHQKRFEKIILQSNGLLYLEGNLVITGEQIEGNFLLGVTPETLKWIPGAQRHVFTSTHPTGPAGMLWTPLRITGTAQAPREDLSTRLAAAAGKAILDAPGDIVGRGSELLLAPVVGKDAASIPGTVIKGATDTTGKAVETGVKTGIKILEGISGGLFNSGTKE